MGATLADTEAHNLIQAFLLSTFLHQDPRYFPSRKRGCPRACYAATRVIVTTNDDGYKTLNTSEVLGTLFTSSLRMRTILGMTVVLITR